ncbi:MAG: class II fructose-bisphosphate aldolase [Actinobacteria bacterium]|nr:class II fructose-bisphosphate aldolase [Actinomycetota bacterium]
MRVPIKFILDYAREKSFMFSRFLITNLESIEALTNAANATGSPFLYDIYFPLMERSCLDCVEELAKRFITDTDIPCGLYADHIESVDACISAIDRGYDGVMIDLSKLSLEENIRGSKEVVTYAHKKGVFVEGEVGIITRSSEEKIVETDPEQAGEYLAKTGVDCLAISIGVYSGFYEGEPEVNYGLIKKLSSLGAHLCLHGASGLSREIISRCISLGMHFVGYGTDPLYRFFGEIDRIRKERGEKFVDPSRILIPARDEMQKEIEEKIYYIKSDGRSREILNLYKNFQHEKTCKGFESMKLNSEPAGLGKSCKDSCIYKKPQAFDGLENLDREKLIKDVTAEVLKKIRKTGG